MQEKNVYIGCGHDIREGFLHVDIRDMPHVDHVCNAWELSQHVLEVDHIYSRHMLEHLTNYEADRTLRDWFKSLKTGGTIRVIVPDMDFHCRQWLDAEWDEEALKDSMSDARHSFAGFWGWQEECDPWGDDYDPSYWSVHKSGYNKKRMRLLLSRIGFSDIEIETKNQWHLVTTATKPRYSGERQVGKTLEEIRSDHLERYVFASSRMTKSDAIVTDAACGVGYGSFVLAQNKDCRSIYSLDISDEALAHAKKYFDDEKIVHQRKDLAHDDLPKAKSDYFISFETIEHLSDPEDFISKVAENLVDDGVFIGSTPNEDIMPFIQQNFLFHTRHFTVSQLRTILLDKGFVDIEFFQQKRASPSTIAPIDDGQYIIFVARKADLRST